MSQLKIVIFCGYKIRELDSLLLLKQELEKSLSAKVYIVGGLSELQRMQYLLFTIKPDIVFISQILEKSCRNLASYALRSQARVYVVPAEITVITVIEQLLLNPDIKYNQYLTRYLLPGERYKRLLAPSDINPKKIKIVGSPKIDCLVREQGDQFLTRNDFCKKYSIDPKKKNIFIFTSFVKAREEYLKSDSCFDTTIDQLLESNHCIDLTLKKYLTIIPEICKSYQDCNIVLKPHPIENHSVYTHLHVPNLTIISSESFYACLRSIDVAIHWSSTISPECWIKGIPTIQFAPYKKYDKFLSESFAGNPVVRTSTELKKYITKYLNGRTEKKYLEIQKQYLKDNFYLLDGNAVKRIAKIVGNDAKITVPNTKYVKEHTFAIVALLSVEKVLGYTLTQRLLGLVLPGYFWRIAVENHIYIE